ncbi:MAG: energy-coupling factor transporter transmembrane component T family protein [Marvinbryantia sp.]|jgi:energy-coupling factor transport system permease protein
MSRMLSYEQKDTWIDRLTGVTKLMFFLLWSVVSMITYDTRVLLVMLFLSLVIFKISKISWKQIATVFKFIMLFLCLNLLMVYIFAPYEGTKIYGSRTDLVHLFWKYTLTKEQLFYEFNILIKYFTVTPAVLMFLVTTNPSEFAASLNRIGIHYNVGYAVAIALRYVPDVQGDFTKIKHAQEARGIEMSSKASLLSRIRKMASIIFPLIFTGMERIDVISNAMELRRFGKNKKRTWYSGRPLKRNDYLTLVFLIVFSAAALVITFQNGSRFYNPFK